MCGAKYSRTRYIALYFHINFSVAFQLLLESFYVHDHGNLFDFLASPRILLEVSIMNPGDPSRMSFYFPKDYFQSQLVTIGWPWRYWLSTVIMVNTWVGRYGTDSYVDWEIQRYKANYWTQCLTFEKTCTIAKTKELAGKNTQEFHPSNCETVQANKLTEQASKNTEGLSCPRCGTLSWGGLKYFASLRETQEVLTVNWRICCQSIVNCILRVMKVWKALRPILPWKATQKLHLWTRVEFHML